jgi:hypothetical protein
LTQSEPIRHPSRVRNILGTLTGGIARRLAQPPADFWQPSGLRPLPRLRAGRLISVLFHSYVSVFCLVWAAFCCNSKKTFESLLVE